MGKKKGAKSSQKNKYKGKGGGANARNAGSRVAKVENNDENLVYDTESIIIGDSKKGNLTKEIAATTPVNGQPGLGHPGPHPVTEGKPCEQRSFKGLSNLGNTCFFNSAMQCLAHSYDFIETVNEGYKNLIEETEKNPSNSKNTLVLLEALRGFFCKYHSVGSREKVISPSALFYQIAKMVPRFRGYKQQDSQEFLCYLLDMIHDQFRNTSITCPVESSFGGYLYQFVKCMRCGNVSTKKEFTSVLSLPLPLPEIKIRTYRKFKKENTPEPETEALEPEKDLEEKYKASDDSEPKLSKNQLKKQKRQERKEAKKLASQNTQKKLAEKDDQNSALKSDEASINSEDIAEPTIGSPTAANSCNSPVENLSEELTMVSLSGGNPDFPNEIFCPDSSVEPETIQDEMVAVQSPVGREEPIAEESDPPQEPATVPEPEMETDSSGGDGADENEPPNQSYSYRQIDISPISDSDRNEWLTPCSIGSCLRDFTSTDYLTDDNQFSCDYCNRKSKKSKADGNNNSTKVGEILSPAEKRYLLKDPPQNLILHLKRFHQVGRSFRKMSNKVEFKELFEISAFCSKNDEVLHDHPYLFYSLYGVVSHGGSLHGGHYVSYIKKRSKDANDKWYYISDGHFQTATLHQVLNAEAYILFYERVPIPKS